MAETKIIASGEALNSGEVYKTTVRKDQHQWITDELPELGGKDLGPSPGDLLCMSLASCKVITLRMYAQRKNWKLEDVRIKVDFAKGSDVTSGNNTFFCEVELRGDLNEEQRKRLMEIAKACPIQKLLGKANDVVSVLV